MTRHPNATPALTDWIIHVRAAQFANFHDLRQVFGSADVAYNLTIFDIAGNNYRLIADVDYARGRVYIKAFLTHAEYAEWNKQMRKSKKR